MVKHPCLTLNVLYARYHNLTHLFPCCTILLLLPSYPSWLCWLGEFHVWHYLSVSMIEKSLYLYKNIPILFALLWCYSKNASLLSMNVHLHSCRVLNLGRSHHIIMWHITWWWHVYTKLTNVGVFSHKLIPARQEVSLMCLGWLAWINSRRKWSFQSCWRGLQFWSRRVLKNRQQR